MSPSSCNILNCKMCRQAGYNAREEMYKCVDPSINSVLNLFILIIYGLILGEIKGFVITMTQKGT